MLTKVGRVSKLAMALVLVSGLALSPIAAQAQDDEGELVPYEPAENIEDMSGAISAAGSSTVAPVTEAMIEDFAFIAPNVRITNQTTGTGGGFELFCAGETEVQNASRPIVAGEVENCEEAGIDYYVFTVALDGIAIVTNPDNDFLQCLTVEEIGRLWQVDSEIDTWDQLDPSFPDEPVDLYGPDPDSGTFDYMVEVVEDITGADGLRADYTQAVDDNVLVEGVAGATDSLGYFGYAYYDQNQDRLRAIAVDSGDGCIEPTPETVEGGTYTPFARPLFLYVTADSLTEPAVQEFVRFYVATTPEIVAEVGYFQAPTETLVEDQAKLEAAIAGEATPDSQADDEASEE